MSISQNDLKNLAWTMLGEAFPGDTAGMTAVGSTVLNRLAAGKYGDSITSIVKAPNQYATWGIGSQAESQGNHPEQRFAEGSPQFKQALDLAQQLVSGQVADPTGGATDYRASGLGTGWARGGQTVTIGGNTFLVPSGESASSYADGNKSSQVATIQQQLTNAGFDPGGVDGVSGPATTAAIKAFQKANGLTVDGIVGPQTSAALAASAGGPSGLASLSAPGGPAWAGVNRLVPGQITLPPPDSSFASDIGSAMGTNLESMLTPQARITDPLGLGPNANALAAMLPQVAPTPMPRPASLSVPPAAPQAAPSQPTVRLASGQMIAPGIYPSNDGRHSIQISAGPDGNAVITRLLNPGEIPGIVDPLHEAGADTIVGGAIRQIMGPASGQVSDTVQAAGADAAAAASQVGTNVKNSLMAPLSGVGSAFSGIGSAFSGMFGGGGSAAAPAWGGALPWVSAPAVAPLAPTLSTPNFGNDNGLAPSIIANPAYAAWLQQYGSGGANSTLLDIHDLRDSAQMLAQQGSPRVVPPAPPKTISVPGGGGNGGGYAAPPVVPTVRLASGASAPVGATGTAQGGAYNFVVQPDGSVMNMTTGRVSATPTGPTGVGAVANAPAPQDTTSQILFGQSHDFGPGMRPF